MLDQEAPKPNASMSSMGRTLMDDDPCKQELSNRPTMGANLAKSRQSLATVELADKHSASVLRTRGTAAVDWTRRQ